MKYIVMSTFLPVAFMVIAFVVNWIFKMLYPPGMNWRTSLRATFYEMLDSLYGVPLRAWRRWLCKHAKQYLLKHDQLFRQ